MLLRVGRADLTCDCLQQKPACHPASSWRPADVLDIAVGAAGSLTDFTRAELCNARSLHGAVCGPASSPEVRDRQTLMQRRCVEGSRGHPCKKGGIAEIRTPRSLPLTSASATDPGTNSGSEEPSRGALQPFESCEKGSSMTPTKHSRHGLPRWRALQ